MIYTFSVIPPLYLPFYNEWGRNAYYKYEAFRFDPFTLRASSTSGSPVILGGGSFFGFMNEAGGSFSYDGCGTLTVTCDAGQELYYNEDCNPYEEWKAYNAAVLKRMEENSCGDMAQAPQKFWGDLEYCTWVDQKNLAVSQGLQDMAAPLSETFVYDYMKRVKQLGLPKGKLTIDDGWDVRYAPDGRKLYGNWEIDRSKFPHMERLVKDIAEEGFIPGLWFAPFTFTPNCELAKKYPNLIGDTFSQNAEDEASRKLMFICPDPVLEKYYTDIFGYYISMGFRKFKLDMSYGNKAQMKQLLALIYQVIKKIDRTVEVEAHIPDIFASRYCDTVRINDVAFDDRGEWRAVTMEHYKTCRFSAAGKNLNLDHLGTNTPVPREEQYLEHTKMLLKLTGGYPCVSLLPDHFSKAAQDTYVGLVREWKEKNDERVL